MSIRFEHTVVVARPVETVFALVDDPSQTPRWLARCTAIDRLSPAPNAVGSTFLYHYRESGRTGRMEGRITARSPQERLTFEYRDRMMRVTVDFRLSPAGAAATQLTHAIEITPQTFFCRLMSPLIRRQLPHQTITAMESLKALLETGG